MHDDRGRDRQMDDAGSSRDGSWRDGNADLPVLSVCVPAYARPDMLARALRSVDRYSMSARKVELLVSDNAPDLTEGIVRPILAAWPGRSRYIANRPNIGMVANFNQCVTSASGQWVLILHDDDYLLPGALERIVATLRTPGSKAPIHLFGAAIVDASQRVRRHQKHQPSRYLPPPVALRRLLTNSSFVRFPSMVVARGAYLAAGGFRDGLGGTEDLAMWMCLFSRYGVCLDSAIVSAYTIHQQADTEGMFKPATIRQLLDLFEEARATAIIDGRQLERARRTYLDQFVLAGAYRQLLAGRPDEGRRILALRDLPEVAALGRSIQWAPAAWMLDRVVGLPAILWPAMSRVAGALERFLWMAP